MKHGYCLQWHSSYLCEGRDIIGAGPDNYHLCHQCLFVATTKLSVATLFCVPTQGGMALLHSSVKPFLCHFCPYFHVFYAYFSNCVSKFLSYQVCRPWLSKVVLRYQDVSLFQILRRHDNFLRCLSSGTKHAGTRHSALRNRDVGAMMVKLKWPLFLPFLPLPSISFCISFFNFSI